MARGKATGRYSPDRRGRRRDKDDDTNRWLGTYGDAVTLLMAFFVMLYAMSQLDQAKFDAFVQGLEVPFGNPVTESVLTHAPSIVGDEGAQEASVRPQPVLIPEQVSVIEDSASEDAEDVDGDDAADANEDSSEPSTIDLEQLQRVKAAVDSSLESDGLSEYVSSAINERGLIFSIAADDILFDTGSTRINSRGRKIVASVAGPLLEFPNDVLVEGHTDDVPLNRAGYTNWNLSTDRAVAVLTMLFEDFEMPQSRLGAMGYGEFRPQVPNDSRSNRALNRRVDVLVVAQGAKHDG